MLFGFMLVYWINYGFYYHSSDAQWRGPLVFQAIFALYCITVVSFLPGTLRWLLRYRPQSGKGEQVLARLRGKEVEHPGVQMERAKIVEAIKLNREKRVAG